MDSLVPSAQPSEESGNKVEEGQRSPTRTTFPSGNQQGHLKPWHTLFYSPLGTLSICLWWGNSSACSCQLFSFSPIIWQCPHVRLCKQSFYSMCLQGHYSEAFWSDSIGSYITCQQYLECSVSVKNSYEVYSKLHRNKDYFSTLTKLFFDFWPLFFGWTMREFCIWCLRT